MIATRGHYEIGSCELVRLSCFLPSDRYSEMMQTELALNRDIYTVSRLNTEVARLLNGSFPLIWLEAEISNLARPRSGHLYFSLKDDQAQIRAAMFRNRSQLLEFTPEEGMQVLVRARVGLYEPRGDFQLVIEHMEETGSGALQKAFEALKRKLQAEGLFDPEHKQATPAFPQHIGVITSPSGAAIRDVLSVLKRRYPFAAILIYPVPVQGADAAEEIAATLKLASIRDECDVLLLVRGGGSLEDLQPFNDERVARAIAGTTIPLVSGVGHEVDFTIADFVADVRAPTPSAAAELISPDIDELRQQTSRLSTQLQLLINQHLEKQHKYLQALTHRLTQQHPRQRLNQQSQRLDELELRLRHAWQHYRQRQRARVDHLQISLMLHAPKPYINNLQTRCRQLQQRLAIAIQQKIADHRRALEILNRGLNSVSPLATLQRGYAIVSKSGSSAPLRDVTEITEGESLRVRLAQGELKVTVDNQ